jgi:hypothetical protein
MPENGITDTEELRKNHLRHYEHKPLGRAADQGE